MGTPEVKIRITDKVDKALKSVVAAYPKWSISQLADSLLLDACQAILKQDEHISFPTVEYVRSQIHPALPRRDDKLLDELTKLRYDMDRMEHSMRVNEEASILGPPGKSGAGR